MNVGSEAKVLISGTIVYRDKDGNVIKEVPFNGVGKCDSAEQSSSGCTTPTDSQQS